jgi:hypothetical protein
MPTDRQLAGEVYKALAQWKGKCALQEWIDNQDHDEDPIVHRHPQMVTIKRTGKRLSAPHVLSLPYGEYPLRKGDAPSSLKEELLKVLGATEHEIMQAFQPVGSAPCCEVHTSP